MTASSFPWFRQSGRDDPHALCIHDGEQTIVNHPEQDIAILAVIFAPILADYGKRIVEGHGELPRSSRDAAGNSA
jgi:hypothetical protein